MIIGFALWRPVVFGMVYLGQSGDFRNENLVRLDGLVRQELERNPPWWMRFVPSSGSQGQDGVAVPLTQTS